MIALTFHDVDDAAHILLLNYKTTGRVLHWIHAIHNLSDLSHFQILHKVIVQNGRFDELPRSKGGKQSN